MFELAPVAPTADFHRAKSLSRVDWSADLAELRDLLQAALRTPAGTMELRPIQAAALRALADNSGAFGMIRVGGGKGLITLLAPVVVGARKPLLLLPASLIEPLRKEAQIYAQHFQVAKTLTIMSYEKLSQTGSVDVLDRLGPDLIICDEVHKAKNSRGSRAKRIRRYLTKNPACRVLALSGSITGRNLGDYYHILRWCLRGNSPLPHDMMTFISWSQALDQGVMQRRPAGVLVDLSPDAQGETELDRARDAYRKRLTSCAGVISTGDDVPAIGLVLSSVEPYVDHAKLDEGFRCLRELWELPGGEPFESAIQLWQHAREMALGFTYRWRVRPPDEWLLARKAWSVFVRETLASNRRHWDTPAAVAMAIDRGEVKDEGILAAWRQVRPSFTPETVAEWLDDSVVQYCAEWLEREKGLCWVEQRAFGQELARVSGKPYFYTEGCTDSGYHIYDHRGQGGAIVSVQSCGVGMNLQAWHKNLISSHVPSGRHWEQTLGRTHREGQLEDDVEVHVILACIEQYNGLQKAISDGEYIERTTGAKQKLVYSNKYLPSEDEILLKARTNYLWHT